MDRTMDPEIREQTERMLLIKASELTGIGENQLIRVASVMISKAKEGELPHLHDALQVLADVASRGVSAGTDFRRIAIETGALGLLLAEGWTPGVWSMPMPRPENTIDLYALGMQARREKLFSWQPGMLADGTARVFTHEWFEAREEETAHHAREFKPFEEDYFMGLFRIVGINLGNYLVWIPSRQRIGLMNGGYPVLTDDMTIAALRSLIDRDMGDQIWDRWDASESADDGWLRALSKGPGWQGWVSLKPGPYGGSKSLTALHELVSALGGGE